MHLFIEILLFVTRLHWPFTQYLDRPFYHCMWLSNIYLISRVDFQVYLPLFKEQEVGDNFLE